MSETDLLILVVIAYAIGGFSALCLLGELIFATLCGLSRETRGGKGLDKYVDPEALEGELVAFFVFAPPLTAVFMNFGFVPRFGWFHWWYLFTPVAAGVTAGFLVLLPELVAGTWLAWAPRGLQLMCPSLSARAYAAAAVDAARKGRPGAAERIARAVIAGPARVVAGSGKTEEEVDLHELFAETGTEAAGQLLLDALRTGIDKERTRAGGALAAMAATRLPPFMDLTETVRALIGNLDWHSPGFTDNAGRAARMAVILLGQEDFRVIDALLETMCSGSGGKETAGVLLELIPKANLSQEKGDALIARLVAVGKRGPLGHEGIVDILIGLPETGAFESRRSAIVVEVLVRAALHAPTRDSRHRIARAALGLLRSVSISEERNAEIRAAFRAPHHDERTSTWKTSGYWDYVDDRSGDRNEGEKSHTDYHTDQGFGPGLDF